MSAPPKCPTTIAAAMLDMAARAHRLLGCKGASRSDFRWDDEQGEAGLYLLEINTQPGMTPLSLVPEQAQLPRHRLWRAGRAADRRGAVGPMSAAHVRRGGAGAAKPRKAAPRSRAEADRQASCRSARPAPTASPALAFAGFLLAIGRGRADRARHPGEGRDARPGRRSAAPASPSTATRSSASTAWSAGWSTKSSSTSCAAPPTAPARQAGAAAGRCRRDPRTACCNSAGSRTRGCRGGCPTLWSSTSSSARPAALWQDKQRLALIDAEGVVLDRVPVDKMPDLPLLIGPGANGQARDLNAADGRRADA